MRTNPGEDRAGGGGAARQPPQVRANLAQGANEGCPPPHPSATCVRAVRENATPFNRRPLRAGIWDSWLDPYLGKSLADPALLNTRPPDWYNPEPPQ